MHPMEAVFTLPEAARPDYIRSLVQYLGCTYICLWSSDPISPNRLIFLDGLYNQPSSSLGSVGQQLFNQYKSLTFDANDDRVPGLAFKNQRPYLLLQQLELLRLASSEIQTQLFQEARIKTAVFMGCNKGEIELGFSNMSQDEIQTALRSLFPEDFSRQSRPIDPNPPSSSSSSLRSLSAGSPEYSSLIFNIPGTSQSNFPETLGGIIHTMPPVSSNTTATTNPLQHQQQQAIQALSQVVTPTQQFLTPESEQDAIMRAILYVLTSPPSSSTSSTSHHQNLPYTLPPTTNGAFKRYRPNFGPNIMSCQMGSNFRRQSMLNRSFAFFRNLNVSRIREHMQATRPNSTQLHHMISERRRREKINENFQALRALLPPETKKDKASILTSAKETLKSLMSEIEKLSKRNQELVSLVPDKQSSTEETKASFSSSNERLNVIVSQVTQSSSSSTSEERMVDLQVNVRGQVLLVDIVIRLLEFLKKDRNVSLISMGATQGNGLHLLTFRLRIVEESEWDESTFLEAVRRLVTDSMQWQGDQ
ncbi:hypothetical protein RIF29_09003 [Crotalaria pallida]|uniref:BHLH domain-containing protein n=1 Tax=Crotalaria pallida TaxID=3830 RepID=A0AAN9FRD8_CROPI